MPTFTLEEITKLTDGMLTKVEDVKISQIAPPLLSDENTLALALGEEEIANLAQSKADGGAVCGLETEHFDADCEDFCRKRAG